MELQYDGSAYKGWQIQREGKTIQGVIQESIHHITGEEVSVIGAGRTDAGVHALEQVAAFDTHSALPSPVVKRALNALLPEDIRIVSVAEVSRDFHPRFSAVRKRYVYAIAPVRDVPLFIRDYVWSVPVTLDIDAMGAASAGLLGTHDFSSFRGAGCGAKDTVKTVISLTVEHLPGISFLWSTLDGIFIKISIEADGFLRHMVRNIVGTLVEAGKGRIDPLMVEEILKSGDRRLAGQTAPAKGLFLEKVFYDTI